MKLRRSILPFAAVAALAACDQPAPTGPDVQLAVVGGGHRVVGSGHVQSAAGLREFTFHSVEAPDGSVSGSYKIVLPNGLFFEADVTCMAVEENTGWVAGVIRDSNAGVVQIGSRTMFYAIDGGEGPAEDVVSLAAINMPEGLDFEFCAERPLLLPRLTVTDGNVQVR